MVQTWRTADAGEFVCPHDGCGARYKVRVFRLPAKDRDSASCRKCGKVMSEWNDTEVPSYTLIED